MGTSCNCLRLVAQAAWPEHKLVHIPPPDAWLFAVKKGKERSQVMPTFDWTGPLRPEKISPARKVGGSMHCRDGACLLSWTGASAWLLVPEARRQHWTYSTQTAHALGIGAVEATQHPRSCPHLLESRSLHMYQSLIITRLATPGRRLRANSRTWVSSSHACVPQKPHRTPHTSCALQHSQG